MATRIDPGVIFLFPGQSSRGEGMLAPLRARAPRLVARTLERASDALGRGLMALDAGYQSNRDVQVAVFVTNHLIAWRSS